MDNVAVLPNKGQIIVDIEDMSMLKDIKKAISMLKGVGKVAVSHNKALSSYEQSLLDIKKGRVNEYASVDEFFKKMGV